MQPFLSDDFMLHSQCAKKLYHTYAEEMPIIDYHCHISPREIYEDRRFSNVTELWLGGDHYKWRIMRLHGVEEKYITGDAPAYEKFLKFAQVLPRCIGNPMYHWCHLELKNYFGYEGVLNESTAPAVWQLTAQKLADDPGLSARGLILQSHVMMIGTTDDPCDDLQWHQKLRDEGFPVRVCPSFRPDAALNIHKPGFADYLQKLGKAVGRPLQSVAQVKEALSERIAFFDELGCRAADHGLDYVMYRVADDAQLDAIFAKAMAGASVTAEESECYRTALLLHCAREYARRDWAMQLHFSCMRNPNSRQFAALGPDTGFDSMAVSDSCAALYALLDALEQEASLPKTILYSLNPADNAWLDTVLGAFSGEGIRGKIQHGSAWWFNDHKLGMQSQLTGLANNGILGDFIGMLTDSRSFLSYARHEYFRRILCDLLGTWMETGEYPADVQAVGELVCDICTNNAKRYFNL